MNSFDFVVVEQMKKQNEKEKRGKAKQLKENWVFQVHWMLQLEELPVVGYWEQWGKDGKMKMEE